MLEIFNNVRRAWNKPLENGRQTLGPVPPEIRADLRMQAEDLAGLFAKGLGMTPQEYVDTLPPVVNIRESLRGMGFRPFRVETRMPIELIAEISGIKIIQKDRVEIRNIKDWGAFRTPKEPYIVWLADPVDYANVNPSTIRLSEDRNTMIRGGKVREGLFYIRRNPQVLKSAAQLLGFPGSSGKKKEFVPVTGRWIDGRKGSNGSDSDESTSVYLYEVPADSPLSLNLVAAKT